MRELPKHIFFASTNLSRLPQFVDHSSPVNLVKLWNVSWILPICIHPRKWIESRFRSFSFLNPIFSKKILNNSNISAVRCYSLVIQSILLVYSSVFPPIPSFLSPFLSLNFYFGSYSPEYTTNAWYYINEGDGRIKDTVLHDCVSSQVPDRWSLFGSKSKTE